MPKLWESHSSISNIPSSYRNRDATLLILHPCIIPPRKDTRPCKNSPSPLGNDISIKQGGWAGCKCAFSVNRFIPEGMRVAFPRRGGSRTAPGTLCDITPLTKREHLYYIHSRLARHSPKPKEEPKPRGNTIPGPRGLNVPAHPKGRPTRRPTAQAKAAISSSKGPGSPFPHITSAMEGPSTLSSM